MRDYKVIIKDMIRPMKIISFAFGGFAYDFYRYFKYAAWRKSGENKREYRAVKIYHRLEKSMSFKNRNTTSGTEAVLALYNFYKERETDFNRLGYQEKIGLKVLSEFLADMESNDKRINQVREFCKSFGDIPIKSGGVIDYSEKELLAGKLDSPESFFMSRYSVRDFKQKQVERDVIERAISLALKTPSACSRQAWHVYHIDSREKIDIILSLQNGNRGFGHETPCLLILTADLSAFDTAGERYQHWIDGGMFSMSLVMALHSLGLGSCCLNWNKVFVDDIKLRKLVNIENSHTVMMMLAVGYANDNLKVCCSERSPLNEVYSVIE